jgi:hypothetical protein
MHADQKRRYNPFARVEGSTDSAHNTKNRGTQMTRRYLMMALVGGTLAVPVSSLAQDTAGSPKQPDLAAIGAENAKQLLLLMDTDKNGKISKQEWMRFMSAEFDRLDTDHSGELDPHELLASRVTIRRTRPADQGK